MDSFNQVPCEKPIPYKHFRKSPKTKRARRQLTAQPCSLCQDYYAALEKEGQNRAHISCRHRVYNIAPKTPPHYWDIDFPSYDIPVANHKLKPIRENRYHSSNLKINTYHGLDVELVQCFDLDRAESLLQQLENEIHYLRPHECQARIYGSKYVNVPRKVAAFGDPGISYTFSGNTYLSKPWTPVLLTLRDAAIELTGEPFNYVLVNRYKDGNDTIGEHKDDETDLIPNASIVSFSFGAERLFVFKRLHFPNVEMTLPSGSALIMKPPTNKYWKHALPKQAHVKTVRINCTFRVMNLKKNE